MTSLCSTQRASSSNNTFLCSLRLFEPSQHFTVINWGEKLNELLPCSRFWIPVTLVLMFLMGPRSSLSHIRFFCDFSLICFYPFEEIKWKKKNVFSLRSCFRLFWGCEESYLIYCSVDLITINSGTDKRAGVVHLFASSSPISPLSALFFFLSLSIQSSPRFQLSLALAILQEISAVP